MMSLDHKMPSITRNHKSIIIYYSPTSYIYTDFDIKDPYSPVNHLDTRFSPFVSQASGQEHSHWVLRQSTVIMISLENPMRQSGARQMAQLMWVCFMLNFQLRVRLKIKAFSSAIYPLLFLVTSMEVKPPMIWSPLVQMSTKREPLLKISDGLPQVSCPSMCLLNRRVNFFFWKPSVVRKLANFGKYFLGHPKGSLSNYRRDIYIDYMSSSSSSYSAYISTGAACGTAFSFLKLQVVFVGSFMGDFAISFKRWAGTIWLWMVLEVPWSSVVAVMRLELAICLLGSRYILRSRSSSLRISQFLALIYPLRSLHIFSNRFMILFWSLSMRSFSYNLPCNLATKSFRESMLAACSTDFALRSFNSAVRQVFSACNSSFFFFSQVFSNYRVNSSLIFFIGSITDSVSFPAERSWELSPLLNKLLSGCNLIMDLYQLVFLLRLASSRKIYLYSCELRDFLSMSSNFSYWDCCQVSLCSSLKSLIS